MYISSRCRLSLHCEWLSFQFPIICVVRMKYVSQTLYGLGWWIEGFVKGSIGYRLARSHLYEAMRDIKIANTSSSWCPEDGLLCICVEGSQLKLLEHGSTGKTLLGRSRMASMLQHLGHGACGEADCVQQAMHSRLSKPNERSRLNYRVYMNVFRR